MTKARLHNVEKTVFSHKRCWENWTATCKKKKKKKLDHSLTSYIKTSSKWMKDLKVTLDTIKFLEENIGRTLSDINQNNIFFNLSPRKMEIKINKRGLLKLKSFCTAKK